MSVIGEIGDYVEQNMANPVAIGAGSAVIGAVAGAVVGAAVSSRSRKKRTKNKRSRVSHRNKSTRRIKHTSRGWKQDRKRVSKQKWEQYYQKNKGKKRGVKYTKNGQPYILLRNGKARFIKRSKKMKGGSY